MKYDNFERVRNRLINMNNEMLFASLLRVLLKHPTVNQGRRGDRT